MAKQDTDAEAQEKPAPAGKGSGKGTSLGILLLVVLMVGCASAAVVAASMVMRAEKGDQAATDDATSDQAVAEGNAQKAEHHEFTFKDPIIVNVYQTQQRRFLSATPVFILKSGDALSKVEERQVELKDLLIGVFKTKTLAELGAPDITAMLGREIVEAVNAKLELDSGLSKVLFAQFVVQ